MVRTEYAYWFTMSSATEDEIDIVRQKVESGHHDDVVLVTVSNETVAEKAVEQLQDVAGEYFISAHDDQRLLLLRSHAWYLKRSEAHDNMVALIGLLEEALELAKEIDPELTRELAQRGAQYLEQFPAMQKRFRHLDERLEYHSHHFKKHSSSRL